ncbi:tetratricopeptide repeat protein [Tolumonas lignilytica]|uniref:tetratricopeptide repeat protein n=1 Tax=Tolumonas lignilytica TaxID=1283284 RepID=UPI000465D270|nr:tetratricopeptide repeat protein [Tolumonas lignilytica]
MRKFVLGLLLVLVFPVWALPSPKAVSDAVQAGNFSHAEQMLQQILKEKPNSAMAHYELGQVLAREQRHQEALSELNQAKTLDPALKFAKNPERFDAIYRAEVAALQKPVALTTHSPIHPATHTASSGSSLVGFVLSILLVFGAILLAIYFWMRRADKQRKQEQQQYQSALSQEQLSALLQMADAMRDAELECRAASYASEQKQAISTAVNAHRDALLRAISQCKDEHVPLYDEQFTALQAETTRLTQAARSGTLPAPITAMPHEPVMRAPIMDAGALAGSNAQPIIINNNTPSSGGLGNVLTGVVLGEMLAGDRHSETVIYRERREDLPPKEDIPSFDGSTDGSDSAWDEDNSSFDSGNDSGNDDAWS